MLNKFLLAVLSFVILASVSCNSEQDDLAKAQDCLDKIDQNAPETADSCLQYVEKYDSQQANILKCSIYMTSGGLVENKIVSAYKALKEDSQANKHATYMTILALNKPDALQALPKAESANDFCQASGVPGLMYLSNAILAGTTMNYTIARLTGNSAGVDLSDPTQMNQYIQDMLTECADPDPSQRDPKCTENLGLMGQATVSLANNYCDSSEADQDVCAHFNGAVESAGGDETKVGQALLCYLNNTKYNPDTDACF